MSKLTSKNAKKTLKKNFVESKYNSYVASAHTAADNLVDSLYSQEMVAANTTSGSGLVNLPLVQPENSFIEDIIVICTADASFDAGLIGLRAGTTVGGVDIIAADDNAITGSTTAMLAGIGTSIHSKIQASLSGQAALTLVANSVYSTTERTIHVQVSHSVDGGGFDTNTGQYTGILKYVKLA